MRRLFVGLLFGCALGWAVTRLNSSQVINLPNGGQISVGFGLISVSNSPAVNTAVIASHDAVHLNENYCASTNGTTLYTCSLPQKPLAAYAAGELFLLKVDTSCLGSCMLNIDGLGAKTLMKSDGVSAPSGALLSGQSQLIWYDGNVFRLLD